ncbi:MAG: BspA family leucine-rich repeat surface protein, partial [Bacteroidales bacterium]|nr:BspA family leucine-rich repeat surface protein [Bacteroidales bacterium]
MLLSIGAYAADTKVPYVIVKDGTATFYYTNNKPADALPFKTATCYVNEWTETVCKSITKVEFHSSFQDFTPDDCDFWFSQFENLKEIVGMKEYLNTTGVETMKYMFHDCKSLTSLDLSSFNTANVTNMRGMFESCEALKSLDLSSFNTGKTKIMESMFFRCFSLTSIDLSSFNTAKVTDMGRMFQNCTAIKSLNLSSFNTSMVKEMKQMISNCSQLRSIFVGNGWTTASVTESTGIFENCRNLYGGQGTRCEEAGIRYAIIDGGEDNPGYLTKSGQPEYVPILPFVVINDGTAIFYYNVDKPQGALLLQSEGEWDATTRKSITKVVFDDSFKSYLPTNCSSWFDGLVNLTEISKMKENLNTSKVKNMACMFYNCRSLKTIDLSGFKTERVTGSLSPYSGAYNVDGMFGMFQYCVQLTSLDLSTFNLANTKNVVFMFYDCTNLKTIFVDDGLTIGQAVSHNMFYGCNNLYGGKGTAAYIEKIFDATYARIDGGVEQPGYFTKKGDPVYVLKDPYAIVKDGTATFYYGDNKPEGALALTQYTDKSVITQVVFHESFKEYYPISCESWFAGFSNLTEITGMDKYLNTTKVQTMESMFNGCSSLKSLDLSSFSTAKLTDADYMFSSCSNLRTIFVGDGWQKTSGYNDLSMFNGCGKLYGGKGTHCEESSNKYARIDGGYENPGYFTKKGETPNAPYVIIKSGTATFYYGDYYKYEDPLLLQSVKLWDNDTRASITKVVFDKSFKDYFPTSCKSWFEGLQNLTEISGMSDYLNASQVADMSNMFKDCKILKTIDLSGLNTDKVKNMSGMFNGCSKLNAVFADNSWTTINVSDYADMFGYCPRLYGGKGTHCEESDIKYAIIDGTDGKPGYFTKSGDPAYVSTIPKAYAIVEDGTATLYYGLNNDDDILLLQNDELWSNELRSSVTKVVFHESFKDYKPKSCYAWFYEFSNLTEITGMKDYLNTSEVEDMAQMFNGCAKLKSIDLSGFDTKKVTTMRGMFNKCSNLRTIFVDEGWSIASVTEYDNMFADSPKLYGGKGTHCEESDIKYAIIDGTDGNPGYLTKTGETAFLPNEPYVKIKDGIATFYYNNAYSNDALPIQSSTSDANWPEEVRNSVTKVVFDKSFKDYKPTSCRNWFYELRNLTEISGMKEYLNTEAVTNMMSMFERCTKLTILDLSGFNTEKVTNMWSMFYGCRSLQTIIVGEGWNTSSVTSSAAMFAICRNLYGGKGTAYDQANT